MKLLIEISKEVKNRLCFGITYQKDIQIVCEALNNGTPISDNATNGEVLKIMFKPNRITRTDDNTVHMEYDFTPDWWNAPYKAESEE